MKLIATYKHRLLAVMAVAMVAISFLCWLSSHQENSPQAERVQSAKLKAAKPLAIPSISQSPTAQDQVAAKPLERREPVARQMFGALIQAGILLHQETLPFEAQSWEPDLVKALELPAGTKLQRRSAFYRVPGLNHALVRVDSIHTPNKLSAIVATAANQSKVTALNQSPSPLAEAQPNMATHQQAKPVATLAQQETPVWQNAMIADHLMVQVEPRISSAQLQNALPSGWQIVQTITLRGLYLVAAPSEVGVEQSVAVLNKLKGVVQFAEPDFLTAGADTTPNDTLYGDDTSTQQWHLGKIRSPRAWDVIKEPSASTLNGRDVSADQVANMTVVAVVDTGVDYTHPDLAPNIWTNAGESGGGKETNGTDDDANGKKDDWRGWNFVEGNNNPMDDVGHGTHVAGIIGGVGNNAEGISGVCWNVKILPLRIIKKLGTGTYGTYSAAIGALDYISNLNGLVRRIAVANHSWGGSGYSLAMLNAINNPTASSDPLPLAVKSTFAASVNELKLTGTAVELAKIKAGMTITGTSIPARTLVTIVNGSTITLSNYTTKARTNQALAFSNPVRPKPFGVLHVAAAGNSRYNADRLPTYPASIPSPFVISVGATDELDEVASWGLAGSNFGKLNVDLFAPGSNIWSTKLKLASESSYEYESRNGTSMAAPQVAGAAAQLRMWQPALTEMQTRQIVIDQVDVLPALQGKCSSSGRLNVAKMVDRLYQPVLTGSGGGTSGGGLVSSALATGLGVSGRAAKGEEHTLVIHEGKVWAWGSNSWGQLGPNGPTVDPDANWPPEASAVPVEVPGLEAAVMVSAGGGSSYALLNDGSVWAWGESRGNDTDELSENPEPLQVQGLWDEATPGPQAVWIAAASTHRLVANADGSVWGWGDNRAGALGESTDRNGSLVPLKIPGIEDVIMVAANGRGRVPQRSLALKSDGTVWHWGVLYGPDGHGTFVPERVPGLERIVYIAAGLFTGYAIDQDGDVWWWGNFEGGNNASLYPAASNTPVRYRELSNIVSIVAGDGFAIALDAEARLWSWGTNTKGALGTGRTIDSASPPTEITLPSVEGVSAMAVNHAGCSIILGSGEVLSWGRNSLGELGNGTMNFTTLPVPITRLQNIDYISDGQIPFARRTDGTWFSWGDSGVSPTKSGYPQRFDAFGPMFDVKSDYVTSRYEINRTFTLARKTDGTLWAWGAPFMIERFGNTKAKFDAVISPSQALPVQGLGPVIDYAVSGGYSGHCLAVLPDGTVRAWGLNDWGKLGDGTKKERRLPVVVKGLSNVIQVAAGELHSLALKADGTVWAWGDNQFGELGDGTDVERLQPVQVPGISNVRQIMIDYTSSVAVKTDGSVWAWGYGGDSVLTPLYVPGTTYEHYPTPVRIPSLPFIREMATNNNAVFALADNGQVWAWAGAFGAAYLGRIPDSSLPDETPTPVVGLSNVVHISGGPYCVYALKADGSLWSWGENNESGLGNGSAFSTVPVQVLGLGSVSSTQATLGTGAVVDSWVLRHFSTDELLDDSLIEDNADPDQDGMANLLEYALGLDPRVADAAQPVGHIDELGGEGQSLGLFSVPTAELMAGKHYLALSVRRLEAVRQDIDYIVEVSTDLIHWRSGDPNTVTLVDTQDALEVYSAESVDDVPQQYMRLRVQRKYSTTGQAVTSAVVAADLTLAPQISFAQTNSRVSEGAGMAAVMLSIQPASSSPLSVPLMLAGTATQGTDYTANSMVSIPAGQTSAAIPINLLQDERFDPDEAISITLGNPVGLAAIGSPALHLLTITDDEVLPAITQQPRSQIVAVGDSVTITSSASGSPMPSVQWLKNGKAIAGATADDLQLNHVQYANAGSYALKASSGIGSITGGTAELGVMDVMPHTVNVKARSTAVFALGVAGKELSFQWSKDDVPLVNGGRISGATSSTLRIAGTLFDDGGDYSCRVSRGTDALTSGAWTLRVSERAPEILAPVVLVDAMVGVAYGPWTLPVNTDATRSPLSYAAMGLPAGLVLNTTTGTMSGTPSEAAVGEHTVILSARNAAGVTTVKTSLFVRRINTATQGSFLGWIARNAGLNDGLGGRLDVVATATGAFSGVLINGAETHRFTGTLTTTPPGLLANGVVTILRPHQPSLTLTFAMEAATEDLLSSNLSDGTNAEPITAWRADWSALSPPTEYVGYYTLGLEDESGQPAHPRGKGYASLAISSAGKYTLSGRLADGIAFSTAAVVGPQGQVLVHQSSATNDTIIGVLNITAGLGPPFDNNAITGTPTWSRKPQAAKQRLYQSGFTSIALTATGGSYGVPTGIVMDLADEPENAQLVFTGGGLDSASPDIALQIKPGGGVLLPAVNPQKTSLKVLPTTGAFSGSFSWNSRATRYQGLLVKHAGKWSSAGFFLLDHSPSAIQSGQVELKPGR